MTVEVKTLDRHLSLLDSEIKNLRNRSERWAQSKADQWEALRQDLQRIRQEKQMTVMGKKIE